MEGSQLLNKALVTSHCTLFKTPKNTLIEKVQLQLKAKNNFISVLLLF